MSGGRDDSPYRRPIGERLQNWGRPLPRQQPRRQPRKLPCHCWVDGAPELPERTAGLLLAWVPRGDGTWLGRVVVGVKGVEGDMVIVLLVDATHLQPG